MKRALLLAAVSLLVVACGGSDESVGKDVSPTTPANGSSSSGSSSSGAPAASSSGGSSSGSSSGGSSSGASSSGASSSGDAGATGGNCVPKGYAGNEKKIGAYCDKDTACPFQTDPFLVCTATYDPTGTHSFCTTPCSKDSECGSGATCVHDTGGSGCVPTQCAN